MTPIAQASAPRLYRGISASDRRAQRRERLLEAGLEVFGTQGYANSSIRAVSAAASLNSRYFYESFTDREDLLYHVYEQIIGDLASAVVDVTAQTQTIEEAARAGLDTAWRILTEDRRKARVVALEVVGVSQRLERLRRDNRHAFADLLIQTSQLVTDSSSWSRLDPILTARSLMGGVMDMLVDWINGDVDSSVEEIVEHFTQLFTVVTDSVIWQDTADRPA